MSKIVKAKSIVEYWKNRVNYSLRGERWVNIKGFEDYYQVSSFGRVRSKNRICTDDDGILYLLPGRIMKQMPNRTNYLTIRLYRSKKDFKCMQVHQLVCIAFKINSKKKPCVNHKNFITTDNRYSNLEWVTHKENSFHARERFKKGEECFFSKLKSKDIIDIFKSRLSYSNIGRKYSIHAKSVSRIKSGHSWAHITKQLGKPGVSKRYKINIRIANKIRDDFNIRKISVRNICLKYGLKKTNVGYILNNKRWKI